MKRNQRGGNSEKKGTYRNLLVFQVRDLRQGGINSSVFLGYVSSVHVHQILWSVPCCLNPDLWQISIMYCSRKWEQRVHTEIKVKGNSNSCFPYRSAGNCAHYKSEVESCSPHKALNVLRAENCLCFTYADFEISFVRTSCFCPLWSSG